MRKQVLKNSKPITVIDNEDLLKLYNEENGYEISDELCPEGIINPIFNGQNYIETATAEEIQIEKLRQVDVLKQLANAKITILKEKISVIDNNETEINAEIATIISEFNNQKSQILQ